MLLIPTRDLKSLHMCHSLSPRFTIIFIQVGSRRKREGKKLYKIPICTTLPSCFGLMPAVTILIGFEVESGFEDILVGAFTV